VLYQVQDKHQRITTTIVNKIETQNDKLISALWELLDSQKSRLLEGFKDTDNRTHTLVGDLVEDLQAQHRYLFEKGIKDTEQLIRTLVADLVDGMGAQQRRVIVMKRSIEGYGAEKEDNGASGHMQSRNVC
jgi:hypothetical protein